VTTTAWLMPVCTSTAIELSRTLFRKQILPREQFDTIDRVTKQPVTLDLNDDYYNTVIQAFREDAFDQVPAILSDGVQNHVERPEQYRGELVDLEITPEGLDGVFQLTERGADLVRENPKLGVSVKVIEGLEFGNGRRFDRALKHVSMLLDPAATGMSPWKEVALAADGAGVTIDLSEEVYDTMTVPNGGTDPANQPTPPTPPEPPPAPPAPPTTNTPEEDRAAAEALAAAEAAEVELSRVHNGRIAELETELARLRFDRGAAELERSGVPSGLVQLARERVGQLEMQLSRQRFENEAFGFIEAGVPPTIVELARPVLELPQAPVIELARDGEVTDRVDTGQVIRQILHECKGLILLNRELGTTIGKDVADARTDALLQRWEVNG
jgi:hypothetical protein